MNSCIQKTYPECHVCKWVFKIHFKLNGYCTIYYIYTLDFEYPLKSSPFIEATSHMAAGITSSQH